VVAQEAAQVVVREIHDVAAKEAVEAVAKHGPA
jgi:hypothetical protein